MRKLVFVVLSAVCLAEGSYASEVTLSFSQTSGNSETDTLSLSYEVDIKKEPWDFSSQGSYLYKRDSGEETANKLDLEGTISRELNDKLSLQIHSFVFMDPFSGYDFRGGIGPGASLKVNQNFLLAGRVTYTYNNYAEGGTESYAQAELKSIYTKKITKNLNFKQTLSYQISLKNKNDYFLHSKSSFKVPFSSNFSLDITYRIDYQNLLPEGTNYHTDKTFLVGVSYQF